MESSLVNPIIVDVLHNVAHLMGLKVNKICVRGKLPMRHTINVGCFTLLNSGHSILFYFNNSEMCNELTTK